MPDITLTFPEPDPLDLAIIPGGYYPNASPRYRFWLWQHYTLALQVAIELGTSDLNRVVAEMRRREESRAATVMRDTDLGAEVEVRMKGKA